MIKYKRQLMALNDLYSEIQSKTVDYQQQTGLLCVPGCSHCCLNTNIEATILEFIPLAIELKKTGKINHWLEGSNFFENSDPQCILYSAKRVEGGHCLYYQFRPLICRLFGFSAVLDQRGNKILYTCAVIKKTLKNQYLQAVLGLKHGMKIPVVKNDYYRLYSIDSSLAGRLYPINEAFFKALETIITPGYDKLKDEKKVG